MILFGGRGSKSTFLKRFLFHVKPREILVYAEVSLIDLIDSSQDAQSLSQEVWERVKKE